MKEKNLVSVLRNQKPMGGQAYLYYLGQESFLIRYGTVTVLIDGYLTDYVDQTSKGGSVLWERAYPSPVDPKELDFVDYAFCTHAHGDHADPWTLTALRDAGPKTKFVVSGAIMEHMVSIGIPEERIIPLHTHEKLVLGDGITVTAFPAAHEELHKVGEELYEEVGYRFTFGEHTIIHCGDCCMYDGLAEELRGADVAMMPINGHDYFRLKENIIGNFDPKEAVLLAKEAGVGMVIPMHYDLYACNDVPAAHFVDMIRRYAPDTAFHMFVPGERYILG